MGHDQFAENVLEIMLSWFRALMSGVWSLFTGSSGGSLLSWLSGSWKSLLVILLTIGVVTDVVVYLLRWRPFWWWFRKKRMVVDDAILEPNEPLPSALRPAPARRVQPSTRIPRREARAPVQRETGFLKEQRPVHGRCPVRHKARASISRETGKPEERRSVHGR